MLGLGALLLSSSARTLPSVRVDVFSDCKRTSRNRNSHPSLQWSLLTRGAPPPPSCCCFIPQNLEREDACVSPPSQPIKRFFCCFLKRKKAIFGVRYVIGRSANDLMAAVRAPPTQTLETKPRSVVKNTLRRRLIASFTMKPRHF